MNYTDLLTTDFPRGCTNCEARISNFCCSTAWNGICCEFPLKKKQVSNKHSQNSTKQQKFHFAIANQSGPRLRWQMNLLKVHVMIHDPRLILLAHLTQWARKFKKVQAKKKLVKSNKSISRKKFFDQIHFFAISKMAKNQILN